jgi:hypothetical protein
VTSPKPVVESAATAAKSSASTRRGADPVLDVADLKHQRFAAREQDRELHGARNQRRAIRRVAWIKES